MIQRMLLVLVLGSALTVSPARLARAGEEIAPDSLQLAASRLATLLPNTLYLVQDTAFTKLEEEPIDVSASTSAGGIAKMALGFGGVKTWVVIDGATSLVQTFKRRPRFYVAGDVRVVRTLRLGGFEPHGEQRRAHTNSKSRLKYFSDPIDIKLYKLDEGKFLLTPKDDLDPGEYGFATGMSAMVEDFTILKAEADESKP